MLAFEYIFVYTLYINIFLINSYEASMLKTKEQFKRICELGGVSEGLIIY